MTEFYVVWRTKVEAADPEEAALKAWRIMQDKNTTETVVEVSMLATIDVEEIPR